MYEAVHSVSPLSLSAQTALYELGFLLFLTGPSGSNVGLTVAIVAGVVCGVLLIAALILVVSVVTICAKRSRQKRGKRYTKLAKVDCTHKSWHGPQSSSD